MQEQTKPLPVSNMDISPLGIYRCIAQNIKFVLSFTAIVAVSAIIVSLLLPKIYTAKAMLVPTNEDKGMLSSMMGQLGGIAALSGASIGGPTQADLYVTMLKSDTVKDALIDRFRLMEVYKEKLRSYASRDLDEKSLFVAGKKDGVITISVEDKDPKRAADLANAYTDELGKLAIKVSSASAGRNRKFLEERLVKAKSDLGHAEDELKQFQAKNSVVDVPNQSKVSIESIAKLKAELTAQEVSLAAMRMKFTDSSQNVRTANAALDKLKAQIANAEAGEKGSPIPSVGSMPSLGQQYIRLMREFKIQEALVELLTKQYEVAEISESKDVAPFQIIQVAKPPDIKSRPKRAQLVVMLTFIGFVSSIAWVMAQEAVRKKGVGP
jgi:tyrosine-protein kinase Etk/Wzc